MSILGNLGCRVVGKQRIHVRNPFSVLAIYTISCTGFCLTLLWHTGSCGVVMRLLYCNVSGLKGTKPVTEVDGGFVYMVLVFSLEFAS